MLTLHPVSFSPGFEYRSASYVSDNCAHPCWIGYHQIVGNNTDHIELHGFRRKIYSSEGRSEQPVKSDQKEMKGLYTDLAFIRCNGLFLFAPMLVMVRDVESDLLIEGDWQLKELVHTADGDLLQLREMGKEQYSCPFTEMFKL